MGKFNSRRFRRWDWFFIILILFAGTIIIYGGVSSLRNELNTPLEERIELLKQADEEVFVKMMEIGLTGHTLKTNSEIRTLAAEHKKKSIRTDKIFIGFGVALLVIGAILIILLYRRIL